MEEEVKVKPKTTKKTKTTTTKTSTKTAKKTTATKTVKPKAVKKTAVKEEVVKPVEEEKVTTPVVEEKKEEVKKVVKKKTTALKNKQAVKKALTKTSKPSSKTKTAKPKVATKKVVKKDPLKNVNIITPATEAPKTEPKKVEKKKEEKKTTPKKVKIKNKQEKTKLVLPKEWTKTPKEQKKEKRSLSDTQTLTDIFKKSLFEEVSETEYKERKKVKKKKRIRSLIILVIVAFVIALVFYLLLRYNDYVRRSLAVYDVYEIGDQVELKDKSTWHVVSHSGASDDTVTLLLDECLNIDGKEGLNYTDAVVYNSEGKAEYDESDKDSVGYYLINTYRKELEKNVGSVEEIRILDFKEFIKMRDAMGFGYEWSQGNWLASPSYGTWWLLSEQNNKVYIVAHNGSFYLVRPNSIHLIRPVIVIKKDDVTKIKSANEVEPMIKFEIPKFEIKDKKD